jgi:hypothetical protein
METLSVGFLVLLKVLKRNPIFNRLPWKNHVKSTG